MMMRILIATPCVVHYYLSKDAEKATALSHQRSNRSEANEGMLIASQMTIGQGDLKNLSCPLN
ncbi:MAG: hypothetical protein WC022_00060 [Parcubacteria group bacterium]